MYVDSHSLGQLALASKRTASYGKSMKFGTLILYTTKVILRSEPILRVTRGDLGGHFECCPLWNVFLCMYVCQIKSDLFRHHISQKDESGVFTVQTIVSIKHTLIIE